MSRSCLHSSRTRRVHTLNVISFDVLKFVRSPGCDHGHDEESRNGRDINIDILDDYIRTPEVFRVISEKTGVPEGYRTPPGELMGHMGLGGKREVQRGRAARPLSLWSELD